jgi:type IV secretion system protein VirB10
LGQATAHLLEKNLSIAPTLKIRPGYRFAILVVKDLTFDRPYAVGTY